MNIWRQRRRDVYAISNLQQQELSSSEELAPSSEELGLDDVPMISENDGSSSVLSACTAFHEESSSSSNNQLLLSSAESTISDRDDIDSGLNQALKDWAVDNNCTRQCINQILTIFNDLNFSVPKDSRTLLKTERRVSYIPMGLGNYVYVGIEKCIQKLIKFKEPVSNIIELLVNIDGLPVFKSASIALWPILIQFGSFQPIGVAYYCGRAKPPFVPFLRDFVQELLILIDSGISFDRRTYTVKIGGFTADAPARASLKGIIQHTGYYSCERCTVKGVSVSRRIVFDQELDDPEERSGVLFREYHYMNKDEDGRSHQTQASGLRELPIDFVNDFVIDPMHLIFLGVTRRILYYIKGSYKGITADRISSAYLSSISSQLDAFVFPSEFARQPRGLSELDRWKATEFRSFLLYSGPVILRCFLGSESWQHFLSFSIAIRLLSEKNVKPENLNVAKRLLEYFVLRSKEHYGETFCVYNVHGLLHIVDDVKNFNAPLINFSCFQFENHLQKLKRSIRGKNKVLSQIVKRSQELNASYYLKNATSIKIDSSPKNSN